MAHTNQSTLVPPTEWTRNLRPPGKRQQSKRERRAARRLIVREQAEAVNPKYRALGGE